MGGLRAMLFAYVVAALQAQLAHAQGPPSSPPAPRGKELRLSLGEAVRSALSRHPEAARLTLDTQIADAEIARQAGRFDPVLALDARGRHEDAYALDAQRTQAPVRSVSTTELASSLTGRTIWGGLYSLNLHASRLADGGEPGFLVRLRPQYDNAVFARYTQPLLRDGGLAANRGPIDRARLDAERARADRQQRLESLALEVVAAYWTLVVRHERLQIAQANLGDALKLRELIERQVKIGTSPRSDLTQGDVAVSERQQAVQVEELAVVEGERALLDLVHLAGDPPGWDDRLVPTDRPRGEVAGRDYDAELRAAFANRPEFRSARRAIETALVNQAISENQRRPRLDVYAEAGLAGFAGTSIVPNDPAYAAPPELLQGGFGKAVGNLAGAEAPFFEIGIQIEVPLGNRQRAAAARQARLAVAKERAVDVKSLVAHDVRAAFQRLTIASRRVQTATETRRLAEANLAAQETRYRGGGGVLFDVLRAQEDLARAKAQASLAAAEQEVATAQLEAARGTLLAHFGVQP